MSDLILIKRGGASRVCTERTFETTYKAQGYEKLGKAVSGSKPAAKKPSTTKGDE